MSASCLYNGPDWTNPDVSVQRIHQLLPAGLTHLHVFYPGTAEIPWRLHAIPDRSTSLMIDMHCDAGGVAQYHVVKACNPSGLATLIGNPVTLTTNRTTYRTMVSRYNRAGGNNDTRGSDSVALNSFLVNWGSIDGYPGPSACAGTTHQTAANAAQVVLANEATIPSVDLYDTNYTGPATIRAARDLYLDVMATMTNGDYAFINVTDVMSFSYGELSIWYPILTSTNCDWIVRCQGETDVLAYFQDPSYTIETLTDGLSVLIRNF